MKMSAGLRVAAFVGGILVAATPSIARNDPKSFGVSGMGCWTKRTESAVDTLCFTDSRLVISESAWVNAQEVFSEIGMYSHDSETLTLFGPGAEGWVPRRMIETCKYVFSGTNESLILRDCNSQLDPKVGNGRGKSRIQGKWHKTNNETMVKANIEDTICRPIRENHNEPAGGEAQHSNKPSRDH